MEIEYAKLSRQLRRAINRRVAQSYINRAASEHSRADRRDFTRQLANRLNAELPKNVDIQKVKIGPRA